MPMTRLQITPRREQGRTKRKVPCTGSWAAREVERPQIRTGLGEGRRRRRRRRRDTHDGVVDGWCWNEGRANNAGDSGGGLGVAVVDVLGIVDRYGGAFGAVGEGVASGAAGPEAFRDRDTAASTGSPGARLSATLASATLTSATLTSATPTSPSAEQEERGDRDSQGTVETRQHAAVPDGQEMEGLSLAGSRRRSPGGAGSREPPARHAWGSRDPTDDRLHREEAAQA